MAYKTCCINNHNNVAQQLKEIADIRPNKLNQRKHLNTQTVKSCQEWEMYIKHSTLSHVWIILKKQQHILVHGCVNHYTFVFSYDKGC